MRSTHRIQRVLHVEYDKRSIRDVKLTLFKDKLHSYNVKAIQTKNEVIRNLELFEPSLIITSHKLNGFNSEFVIEEVKRRMPNVPIILLSDEIYEEYAIPYLRKGAWDVVHKSNEHLLPVSIFKCLRESYFRVNVPTRKQYKGMEIQPLPKEIGRWILHR